MSDDVLVGAPSCPQIQAHLQGAVVRRERCSGGQKPLAAITAALRRQRALGDPPRNLHLLAHGRPGAYRFGDTCMSRYCDDSQVLGDSSCPQIRKLLAASRFPASALNPALSPFEAISEALREQRASGRALRRLHLIAHGEPGVVWVGDQAIDQAALLANAESLASWGLEEIVLWSCHVGANRDYIALLEELTGAVVYSSVDRLERTVDSDVSCTVQNGPDLLANCIDLGDVVDLKIAPFFFNLASKKYKKFVRKRSRARHENVNPDGFFLWSRY